MKLVITVIEDNDAAFLMEALVENGFKLPSWPVRADFTARQHNSADWGGRCGSPGRCVKDNSNDLCAAEKDYPSSYSRTPHRHWRAH